MEFKHAIAVAVVVIALLWFRDNELEDNEVSEWLKEHGKANSEKLLRILGKR